ncbi:hypothetical protein OS493_002292, partial [Desmophyllum pertusum]
QLKDDNPTAQRLLFATTKAYGIASLVVLVLFAVAQKCLGPDERMRPNQLDVTTKAKQSPHNSPEVDSPPSVVLHLCRGYFLTDTQRILNSELLVGHIQPRSTTS